MYVTVTCMYVTFMCVCDGGENGGLSVSTVVWGERGVLSTMVCGEGGVLWGEGGVLWR